MNLELIISKEKAKSKSDLDMFKSFDKNPYNLKTASESGLIDLIRDLMPKSTEGKVLVGGLVLLGLLALMRE